ncbi:molecular chaperone DnaK [Thermocoleostomius sinensis]|uniref:Chaperone protein DnaK n=1 Tax=Thermocoleostomius sinensis A174 TaxID=2016057 RepID=A0A9E9C6N5_9CYAN|nr:molecular chaperone DnaK [Thermocoleostomius sinensis]WAL58398.1 molecular chaperone DnaK [Thermocoleostomius sinensis A174]
MGKVVGIDLGTTNSVVAVMEGGKPVVIANSEGMRTTPSVVAFSKEGERLVGQMARRQAVLNPQNTFFGVKRYIGRRYNEVSPEARRVPYTIRKDEFGAIKIKCPRLERDFAPEEISSMVLRKLAEEATRYLGEPVTGAVITVPAYFNDSQRQATRDAGRIAGLEVLRILNEPTAASLAYGLDRRDQQTILVFDLGGGTFDVSVLDVGDGVFEVRATSGDTQLGGNDFDKRIVDWLAEQFLEREGVDLRRDRQALQRLMEAAEKAKIELSGMNVAEINLPFIAATEDGPLHLETRLSRSQFEGLCTDLVSRLRGPVREALQDAGLTANEIDEVVLVGGASRMPMVKQLVRSLVDREPNENVNPDEVVAVGAAIQAGILTQEVKDILLLDVAPLSVGLETIGGVMKKLIPRNTTIPVRRSDTFSTSENNQTMVEIHVVQGEREMAADNKSLGRFKLMGIPPAPRGIPQIQVSFDVDANGILQVTALDKTTGREQGITIQGASTLSEAEVQRMIQEAELYADEDRQKRDRIEKRTKAEALTFEAERQLREVALDFGMQFASPYRRKIENLIQELRDCLKQQDDRGIDMAQADLRDALYELQQEVYQVTKEDEDEKDFFGSIRRTLSNLGDDLFGDDDEYYDDRPYSRDPYARDPYARDLYNREYSRDSWGASYERRDVPPRRDYYDRTDYDRSDYDRDPYSSREPYRDSYSRADRRPDRDSDRRSPSDFDRDPVPPRPQPRPNPEPRRPADEYDDYNDYSDRDTYNSTRDRNSRNSSPRRSSNSYDRDLYDQGGYDQPNNRRSGDRSRNLDRRSYDNGYSNAPDEDWGDDDEWL